MKIKICDSPVYLHSMGPSSIHLDIEHPMFVRIIGDGERAFCQGKGEHGVFITLDPEMTERASSVMRMRSTMSGSEPVLLHTLMAGKLDEIADILEVLGESEFRAMAYRRAARSIETAEADLEKLARSGELTSLRWVGESIASTIKEFVETGEIQYLEELRSQVPVIAELLKLPQIDARTANLIYDKLGISTIEDLERTVREGRLILEPQPLTLEDLVTMQIFRTRAGGFSGVLDLVTEGLAPVEGLRRRFTPTSIAYDVPRDGSLRNLFALYPGTGDGVKILFRGRRAFQGEVGFEGFLEKLCSILGRGMREISTRKGQVSFRLKDKEKARAFVQLLRDILEE